MIGAVTSKAVIVTRMELRSKRGPKCALSSTLVLCCCLLLVAVVADKDTTTTTEEEEEATEEAPEALIDNEIDAIDNPHRNRNYVFGKVMDTFVKFTMLGNTGASRMMYGGNSTTNLYGDNSLWEGLFRDCGQASPTLTCVKKSVFGFLDRSIAMDGDLEVTNGLVFTRKRGFEEAFENKYDRRLNEDIESITTEETVGTFAPIMEEDSARSYSSFDDLTNTLYDKGEKFIMSHDLELQLPEYLFDGAVLKISPKAFEEEGGALLKVELNRKKTDSGEARFLFKKHKKKLMMAFFSLLMVIKMIKVKLMFLLPLLLGIGTAKKIFLKLLLFIFPAFAHIFKFCAYYHATRAKFHHHHHQIAHHHHHVPVHVPVPVVSNPAPIVIDSSPSHSYASSDSYGPPLNSYGEPTDSYGPPPGPPTGSDWDSADFITNRNENLPPTINELESWGLMSKNGAYHIPPGAQYPLMYDEQRPARNAYEIGVHQQQSPLIQHQQQQLLLMQQQQQKQAQLAMLQQQKLQQQLQPLHHSQGMHPQQLKMLQAVSSGGPATIAALMQAKQRLKQQQQQAALKMKSLTPRPPIENVAITVPVTYDPFYSPILQRMDNVFVQLGFNEEACRERLVCSMYKAPERFSPHSNLISAELSR